jgi:hypothetical protein
MTIPPDPKLLILLPVLVGGGHTYRPIVHSLAAPTIPVYEWPERQERPEQDHPSDEDASPTYRGLIYSNINVSNAASVLVDSGASGVASGSSYLPGAMWGENNVAMVSSPHDLRVNRWPSSMRQPIAFAPPISPNASEHLNYPSTVKIRESIARRRG